MLGDRYEPRAVLLVPATLDSSPGDYYLQLDTGAGWPRWYEVPLRRLLPRAFGAVAHDTAPDELALSGRIGPITFWADTFLVEKGFGDSIRTSPESASVPQTIGTLGLRFFRHRVLVLDFPHQRLAILDSAQGFPADLPSNVTYTPARYENGYLFVPFHAAGHDVDDFFYDSGASAFPLTTTAATWRTLTGRSGVESDNIRLSVSSWGKQVEEVGAPLAGDVVLGPLRARAPLVFSQRDEPGQADFFARVPYHLGGHFGNALFFDKYVVIVDVPNRRFGLAGGL